MAGQVVELELEHENTGQVELRITRMVFDQAGGGGVVHSLSPGNEVFQAETVELSRDAGTTLIRTGALPAGAWRLELEAGPALIHRDVIVTDLSWFAWRNDDTIELAVVDAESGRPEPGVALRIAFMTKQGAAWQDQLYRSDTHGRVSVTDIAGCESGSLAIALQRDGRWLPMPESRCPAPAVPEADRPAPYSRKQTWLQLLVKQNQLRPGVPFHWTAILSAFEDPANRPQSISWSVIPGTYRRHEIMASGTATVGRDGRLRGTFVPGRDWPEGDYEIYFYATQSSLAGSWWRLGSLGERPEAMVELSFSPLGTTTGDGVRIVAAGKPGLPFRLRVVEMGAGAQYVSTRSPPMTYFVGGFQPPILYDRALEIGPDGTVSLDLPWRQHDPPWHGGYSLVAQAFPADWSRLIGEAAVCVKDGSLRPSASMHHRHFVDESVGTQPLLAVARDVDHKPLAEARLRLELETLDRAPGPPDDSELDLVTDDQGKALFQVRAAAGASMNLFAGDDEPLTSSTLSGRREPYGDLWLETEPFMADPGAEAEILIHSPGDNQLALLTAGDGSPIPLLLDQPVKRVTISTPASRVHEVAIRLSWFSDGQLRTTGRSLPLRRPLLDGLLMRRMWVTQEQRGMVLTTDPPGTRGRVLVLRGPILWPPLPLEINPKGSRKSIGPPDGLIVSGKVVRPRPRTVPQTGQRQAPKPPQAISEAAPPTVRTVIPLMVAPLEPARVLVERRLAAGDTVLVRNRLGALPTAVVVLVPDESAAPAFLVVDHD
jgi:hypothetical protein